MYVPTEGMFATMPKAPPLSDGVNTLELFSMTPGLQEEARSALLLVSTIFNGALAATKFVIANFWLTVAALVLAIVFIEIARFVTNETRRQWNNLKAWFSRKWVIDFNLRHIRFEFGLPQLSEDPDEFLKQWKQQFDKRLEEEDEIDRKWRVLEEQAKELTRV